MTDANGRDGARDFDFLFGSWTIANRRLASRLTGCTEWGDFAATLTCQPVLGGMGNIDGWTPVDWSGREGFEGGALRLYDREQGVWRIWWMTNAGGELDVPVIGRFVDGVGAFYCDDLYEGQPVKCRFLWHDIRANSAAWEQALSSDGGKTWETNWVMSFTRVS